MYATLTQESRTKDKKTKEEELKDLKAMQTQEIFQTLEWCEWNIKKYLDQSIERANWNIFIVLEEGTQVARVYNYAEIKANYLKKKHELILQMESDILTSNIVGHEIGEISENLNQFTRLLESLTDAYIAIMPRNTEEVFRTELKELYRDIVFEENFWIDEEATTIRKKLDEWLENHLKEVKQNKDELHKILKDQKQALWDLLTATSTLREDAFSQIRVQL